MKNGKMIDNKINKKQKKSLKALSLYTHTHTHTRILLKYKRSKNNSSQLNMNKNRGRTVQILDCIGLSLCDFAGNVHHNHRRGRPIK